MSQLPAKTGTSNKLMLKDLALQGTNNEEKLTKNNNRLSNNYTCKRRINITETDEQSE